MSADHSDHRALIADAERSALVYESNGMRNAADTIRRLVAALSAEPVVEPKGEDDETPNDLLYDAWALIANASGGMWERESRDWRDAAIRWRDEWHATLRSVAEPVVEPPPTDGDEINRCQFVYFGAQCDLGDKHMRPHLVEVTGPLVARTSNQRAVPTVPTCDRPGSEHRTRHGKTEHYHTLHFVWEPCPAESARGAQNSETTPAEAQSKCERCSHNAHDGYCLALNGSDTPPIFCGCEPPTPAPTGPTEAQVAPTTAQIMAAAQALWSIEGSEDWDDIDGDIQDHYRNDARIALVAAAAVQS